MTTANYIEDEEELNPTWMALVWYEGNIVRCDSGNFDGCFKNFEEAKASALYRAERFYGAEWLVSNVHDVEASDNNTFLAGDKSGGYSVAFGSLNDL